ncbi:MAG: Maf-like protein [Candidatus Thiodiazotropha lotti]|uniref:7-methyl-GTP pyrophosphatase n=1 Tax=Candidatus Thiodiazotropha endoloripes TaxID=1818881 RepID=A0A1E2UTA2_9GAMM|nr:Maf family nucleotide pyrophosphatase [Candidatus Thiodiazotropha endoloripes]MCG7900109.1 Maf-like protein [Candidatus Thiodiazotropha weberae]MCG7990878.1 Maf-like protein [Candidatus Thiodiazotropha lotti]MCG7901509.1 Maf-like protein [Candidatus Thiodiazotropha weberae]MCG7913787.1 Maf-like protein [Candidatus Thiodiazotropha weberae]MCG7999258.1 Maf-like protein [Candidatus Thiodiazotropha lotti]
MTQVTQSDHLPLVLASSSPFRRELLSRLGLEFSTSSPDVDESRLKDESAEALVLRLSQQKAMAVAESHPEALIIGSDQVATVDGEILGKPGNHEKAIEQLLNASGKKVTFYTGLTLHNSKTGRNQTCCEPFHVQFRTLNRSEIENYLLKEQPYNCAGSFKSEGLGISLFEYMEGADPNALIGLPLIRLNTMLRQEGVDILAQ